MRSIGIDIGKKKCVVAVMDSKKRILEEFSYDNTVEAATACAREMKRKHRRCQAAIESTGNHWLKTYEVFESCGIPIQLANPRKMKIISNTHAKTDKIDARKIADVLRTGNIPQCHVAPPDVRDDRQVVRSRISLVQDRTRIINRARSLLHKYDVALNVSQLYSPKGQSKMAEIALPRPTDEATLRQHSRHIAFLTAEIAATEENIRKRAVTNTYALKLMSLPGVDTFTAMLLASEIDDIRRFDRPSKMVSWAGMCPTVSQSGDSLYYGRMKKEANRIVRWALIQSAYTAVRADGKLKAYYERVLKRHGGNNAVTITHVANKMLHIMWHMLRRDEQYSQTDEALYSRKLERMGRE